MPAIRTLPPLKEQALNMMDPYDVINTLGSRPGMSDRPMTAGDGRPVDPMLMPGPAGMQRYREMTIDELLLENRVVFLVGAINYQSATSLIMRMLYLSHQSKNSDISLYINSPGGSVDDTLAILDTMRFVPCDVSTYCIGRAMSGGAIILAAGTKGKRFILPHAKVMVHQPYGGIYGQTADVQIQAEEILRTKKQLNELMSEMTGQSVERIEEDAERDKYFSAAEAQEYGIVDEVLQPAKAGASGESKSNEKKK